MKKLLLIAILALSVPALGMETIRDTDEKTNDVVTHKRFTFSAADRQQAKKPSFRKLSKEAQRKAIARLLSTLSPNSKANVLCDTIKDLVSIEKSSALSAETVDTLTDAQTDLENINRSFLKKAIRQQRLNEKLDQRRLSERRRPSEKRLSIVAVPVAIATNATAISLEQELATKPAPKLSIDITILNKKGRSASVDTPVITPTPTSAQGSPTSQIQTPEERSKVKTAKELDKINNTLRKDKFNRRMGLLVRRNSTPHGEIFRNLDGNIAYPETAIEALKMRSKSTEGRHHESRPSTIYSNSTSPSSVNNDAHKDIQRNSLSVTSNYDQYDGGITLEELQQFSPTARAEFLKTHPELKPLIESGSAIQNTATVNSAPNSPSASELIGRTSFKHDRKRPSQGV